MSEVTLCPAEELLPGQRMIVSYGGRSIGVFNVGGRYFALLNLCPHQGALLCDGAVDGTYLPSAPGEFIRGLEGQVLRCPWHGWEFNLEDGKALFAGKMKVKTYPVFLRDGFLVLIT